MTHIQLFPLYTKPERSTRCITVEFFNRYGNSNAYNVINCMEERESLSIDRCMKTSLEGHKRTLYFRNTKKEQKASVNKGKYPVT